MSVASEEDQAMRERIQARFEALGRELETGRAELQQVEARRTYLYERAERAVALIEETFPVVCSTYNNHGTTGRSLSIDIWVAPFHNRANKAQEAFGDKIQKWIEANEKQLGWHYILWWNWMRYDTGTWFDYTPWSKPASQGGWAFGDPDQNTRRHEDHVHLQLR